MMLLLPTVPRSQSISMLERSALRYRAARYFDQPAAADQSARTLQPRCLAATRNPGVTPA